MISGLDVHGTTSTPEPVVSWGEYRTVLEDGLRSSESFSALPENQQALQLEKLGQAIEQLTTTAMQVQSLREQRGQAEARIQSASRVVTTPESWLDIAQLMLKGEWKERNATLKQAHGDLKALGERVLSLLREENNLLSDPMTGEARRELARIKEYLTIH